MRIVEIDGKEIAIDSISVDGIDTKDYPDFCDAYVEYAEFTDGEVLTSQQLEQLMDDYPDIVHMAVWERIH